MQTVAALSILRDDPFYLEAWLRHYTRQVGRQNCYLVAAGASPDLLKMAEGCSVIRLPEDAAGTLIRKRGRLANNLVAALLNYHKHVVFTELDERVIVDPDVAKDLQTYLLATPGRQVLTPMGLELIRRPLSRADPVESAIADPRQYVRIAPELCKPCILSTPTSLSRDGRYSRYPKLHMPEPLYLLGFERDDRVEGGVGPHALADEFDLSEQRRKMLGGWQKMGTSAYWHVEACEDNALHCLPERFDTLL